jgi:Flp pilus assembly protein TadB
MDDARLARIESKLDKLSDAVVSLARMEERMLTLFKRMDKYEQAQDNLTERVTEVEKISIGRGAIFRVVDKATWIVVGVIVALVIEFFAR